MGAWGFFLFQSDMHLDVACELADHAGVEDLLYPDNAEQVKIEVEGATLNALFDAYKKKKPQPVEYITMLGALAMGLGVHIREEDLKLIRRCLKREAAAEFLMKGVDQLKTALKVYKNDGTPYSFNSPGLIETAIVGTPYPAGHPMQEAGKAGTAHGANDVHGAEGDNDDDSVDDEESTDGEDGADGVDRRMKCM